MAETLHAEARVVVADAEAAIAAITASFAGARIRRTPTGAIIEGARVGRMALAAEGGSLVIACTSENATTLSLAKMVAADALCGLPDVGGGAFAWTGDCAGPQPLPYFRALTVVGTCRVTPRMARVVLAGAADRYDSGSLHVRVLIPPKDRAPVWPHADPAGRTIWPRGVDALVPRVYTVRRVDVARGEIAIDVALHAGAAPGSDWARRAAPGETVGLMGPGGAPFEPAPFNLLLGDETAIPAIARILEALPAGVHAVARIEVADAGEVQPLASPANVDIAWLPRNGAPAGTTALLEDAARAVGLPVDRADARVFAGCEQSTARRLRAYFSREAGLEKSRLSIAAYWRLGHEGVDIGD